MIAEGLSKRRKSGAPKRGSALVYVPSIPWSSQGATGGRQQSSSLLRNDAISVYRNVDQNLLILRVLTTFLTGDEWLRLVKYRCSFFHPLPASPQSRPFPSPVSR